MTDVSRSEPDGTVEPSPEDSGAYFRWLQRRQLRDELAKAALTGILSDHGHLKPEITEDYVAEIAYRFADAMLKAREAK